MLEKFEHDPPTCGPTHIERPARPSEHRGGEVEIYTKREDRNSALAFCGNKRRKAEYIIPDPIASNADMLVSIGVQSNHNRMVAAKIGMKCPLVQESWVPHGDAVHDRVGNVLLLSLFDRESVAGSGAMARTLQPS